MTEAWEGREARSSGAAERMGFRRGRAPRSNLKWHRGPPDIAPG